MIALPRPGPLSGSFSLPASKSHGIRALLLAALAEGESRIEGLGGETAEGAPRSALSDPGAAEGGDLGSAGRAARLFGAELASPRPGLLLVRGTGGLLPSEGRLDCGNSGSLLYFGAALLSLAPGPWTLDGDGQTRQRPALPLLAALSALGAEARGSGEGGSYAPLEVGGSLRGGQARLDCPTSQYLSALLLSLPLAPRPSELEIGLLNERPYVDLSLSWLERAGLEAEELPPAPGEAARFRIPGGQLPRAFSASIPADWSSAAFLLGAAAASGGSLTLSGLSAGDGQGDAAIVDRLRAMGCQILERPAAGLAGESSSEGRFDLEISGPETLSPIELDLNATPDLLPVLAALAALARGRSRLYNVAQARIKESDRIAAMAALLSRLGARVEELPDGLLIEGPLRALRSGEPILLDSGGDHRVAMALGVLALGLGREGGGGARGAPGRGALAIAGAESASVSFPGYWRLLGAELLPG